MGDAQEPEHAAEEYPLSKFYKCSVDLDQALHGKDGVGGLHLCNKSLLGQKMAADN